MSIRLWVSSSLEDIGIMITITHNNTQSIIISGFGSKLNHGNSLVLNEFDCLIFILLLKQQHERSEKFRSEQGFEP